jgi:hypothetical protein
MFEFMVRVNPQQKNGPNIAMQRKTPFGSFFYFGGYSKFPASVGFREGRFR